MPWVVESKNGVWGIRDLVTDRFKTVGPVWKARSKSKTNFKQRAQELADARNRKSGWVCGGIVPQPPQSQIVKAVPPLQPVQTIPLPPEVEPEDEPEVELLVRVVLSGFITISVDRSSPMNSEQMKQEAATQFRQLLQDFGDDFHFVDAVEIAEVRLDGMSLAVACPDDKTYS